MQQQESALIKANINPYLFYLESFAVTKTKSSIMHIRSHNTNKCNGTIFLQRIAKSYHRYVIGN